MKRPEFRKTLEEYRKDRSRGDKEHLRQTDITAGSLSPQKLDFTPVGLMFYEGAPRLRKANVTIPGLQNGDPNRVTIEAYPGVLARQFIGRHSYKQDKKKKQTRDQHQTRKDLLAALLSDKLQTKYGLRLSASPELADDPTGDHLDALLCAIQAAWAYTRKEVNYGAPISLDSLKGWIAHPSPTGGIQGRDAT